MGQCTLLQQSRLRRATQEFFRVLVMKIGRPLRISWTQALVRTVALVIASVLSGCGSGSSPAEPMQQPPPSPLVPLTRLSTDSFTNTSSQHATEVEPDTFAFESTLVSAFQVGRVFSGGGADVGFATSTDGGVSWTSGLLPGITIFQGGGNFSAVSDASVAYDASHSVWLIASLALGTQDTVIVSRSPDGINWGTPVTVAATGAPDKNWIACDNTPTSPFYGQCYVEWDDSSTSGRDLIHMNTSSDGGLTWGTTLSTADLAQGLGGQPVVQPGGNVIVPILSLLGPLLSFSSRDGGATWSRTVMLSSVTDHREAGGLRSSPLPSAEVDSAGKVYVVWPDCRFRTGCSSNDLVLSTSPDGVTWTSPSRIPIDPLTSTVDHFIPGLAVDPATSGAGAHLTIAYYYYPTSNCGAVCDLDLAFVTSQDGGQSWSAPVQLAGPMKTNWLPNTFSGRMVADYISTSYVNGNAFAALAIAKSPSGTVFDEAIETTTNPLTAAAGRSRSVGEKPVPHARSDHGPRNFLDLDHERPVPPTSRAKKRAARKS
jgi:hypothetical protein